MATVADELIIRVVAVDLASKPLRDINQLLQDLGASAASLGGQASQGLVALNSSASPLIDVFDELSVKVAMLAQRMGETAVSNALAFEDRMTTIARVSGLSADGIKMLAGDIKSLGLEMRRPTEELAKAAEEAARLGITGDDLLKFVTITDQFAIGVGGAAGDAAKALAQLKMIFHDIVGEGQGAMDRLRGLASAVVAVDSASSATAPQIMASLSKMASAVELGFSPAKLMAYAGALIGVGQNADLAGTRINSAIGDLVKGSKLPKAAALLGVTSEKFRNMFDSHPEEVLDALIMKIDKMTSASRKMGLAEEIFGRIGSKAIVPLGGQLDKTASLMKAANDELENGTALTDAFNMASSTTQGSLDRLHNAYFALTQEIGERFLSAIKAGAAGLMDFIGVLRGLNQETDDMHFALGVVSTALTVFGTIKLDGISKVIALLTRDIGTLTGATGLLTKAWGVMTGMSFASVATGAASLAGALAPLLALWAIWENWDTIVAGWENIRQGAMWAVEEVGRFWDSIAKGRDVGQVVLDGFVSLWQAIRNGFVDLMGGIILIIGDFVVDIGNALADESSVFASMWNPDAVKKAFQNSATSVREGLSTIISMAEDVGALAAKKLGAALGEGAAAAKQYFVDIFTPITAPPEMPTAGMIRGLSGVKSEFEAMKDTAGMAGVSLDNAFGTLFDQAPAIRDVMENMTTAAGAVSAAVPNVADTFASVGVDVMALDKTAETDPARAGALTGATAAHDKYKTYMDGWLKWYEANLQAQSKLAESTERQITGSMQAIAQAISGMGTTVSGLSGPLQTILTGGSGAGQGGFGMDLQTAILQNMRMQNELAQSEIELNKANLEVLKMKQDQMKAGKTDNDFTVKIEGGNDLVKPLVTAVSKQLLEQARAKGGFVCAG